MCSLLLGFLVFPALSVHRAKACMCVYVYEHMHKHTCALTSVFIFVSICMSWKPPIPIKQQCSSWVSSLSTSPMLRNLAPIILSIVTDLVSFPSCAQSCIAAPSPFCIPVKMPSSPHTRLAPTGWAFSLWSALIHQAKSAPCGRHAHPSWGSGSEDNISYSPYLRQTPTLLFIWGGACIGYIRGWRQSAQSLILIVLIIKRSVRSLLTG